MKTGLKEFDAELAELRAIAEDYRRMRAHARAELQHWRKARRALVDLLVAESDPRMLELVLAHMERTICEWERWPAAKWPQRPL
jgi:hypothetical protein